MFCKYCGKEIEDDSKFCKFCGNALTQAIVESSISKEIVDDEPEIIYSYNYTTSEKEKWCKTIFNCFTHCFCDFSTKCFHNL